MILNTRNVDRFVLETKEGFLNLQSREWRRMSKEKGPEQIWVRGQMKEVEKVHFKLTSIFSINVGSEIRVKVVEMGTTGKGQKEMLWRTLHEVNS